MTKYPRVPLPTSVDLIGRKQTLQVNHCRNPHCGNYGTPARSKHGKPGPSPDRDKAYKVHSTSKGSTPSIRCKSCLNNPPIRSNAGIAQEIDRLLAAGGLWKAVETTGCANLECVNHDRPIAFNRSLYYKRGRTGAYNAQVFQCKSCGRKMLMSDPVRLGDKNKRLAADLFGRIANKSPVRGAVRGSGLTWMNSYYNVLKFIHARCRSHSGAIDRALIDGRLSLPKNLVIESDAQEYTLNWVSRLDRRNVVLSSYCTVDSRSGFILGMHSNFDGRVNPFDINVETAAKEEFALAEPFRKYPQYWLAGDELRGGRAMHKRLRKHDSIELMNQITALYATAEKREDVEDIELHYHNDLYCRTPSLGVGMQVHLPYTVYAHWFLLHRILSGAGVKRLQANMDISSTSRAAFLCAFAEEVMRGDANGFFVRYTKYQTVDQRKSILRAARNARDEFRKTLPPSVRRNNREVIRRMMRARIEEGQSYGKWKDEWIEHPVPAMNEPQKAMSWLTSKESICEDRKVDMFLAAGIARVDNVFMKSRRLFSALERPVGTSSGHNTVWHGYAPYNAQMLEKYLTLFRSTHNFIFVGEDDKTPAMRLGFATRPLTFEDILWPGQRIPRPRRARRKGWEIAVVAS